MSAHTEIPWCDSTANLVIGCTKVSPGCANCYAEHDTPARVLRHGKLKLETWGPKGARHEIAGYAQAIAAYNRKPWICNCGKAMCPEAGRHGHHVHRRRIFHGSNNDFLDDRWPIELLAKKLEVIRRAPDCIHILCSKRWENFETRVADIREWLELQINAKSEQSSFPAGVLQLHSLSEWLMEWILGRKLPPNILGLCSVENQEWADKRLPTFLKIPLACRGLSCEPLLGPIDLCHLPSSIFHLLAWLIIGGESGPGARPCQVEWIRSLARQGQAAHVATFVKQLGTRPCCHHSVEIAQTFSSNCCECFPLAIRDKKGANPEEWPQDLRVRQFPKNF